MIAVDGLSKTYRVPEKDPGLRGSLRSLLNRRWREVHAVADLGFRIEQGERVGFLGPNGAGKTTTLKMLAGLLHPTSGRVEVLGFRPQSRDPEYLRRITLVMGQKQQLLWDLPPVETYELNRVMYGISREEHRRTLDELVAMLHIETLMQKPSRNLSLGERMKCELCAALLHRPQVLFLDEPTIGLDVEMQVEVRQFIARLNEQQGATVLLTSHYMGDIAALTPRLLIIDQGKLRYEGTREALARRIAPERRLTVKAVDARLLALGFREAAGAMVHSAPTAEVNALLARVLALLPDAEIGVEEMPLEEVMSRYFRENDKPAAVS
jgi:ABC-2 type transport system ATP-binding protein